MEELLSQVPELHVWILAAGILAVAAWETSAPRRTLRASMGRRWVGNFGLGLINGFTASWIMPLLGFGVALLAAERGWGLFHSVALPGWLAALLSIALIDLAKYVRHQLSHRVPLLWAFHRVHHADPDFDLTTALRAHPLEAMFIAATDAAIVLALGAPPLAVLGYHAAHAGLALAQHANARLPLAADRLLRWLLVTPDFHRVHHSARQPETDSNYGVLFTWWDFLFGTYCAEPRGGHEGMTVGLEESSDPATISLPGMLAAPMLVRAKR